MAGVYVLLVSGHSAGNRTVGFLEEIMEGEEGESRVDAKEAFESIPAKKDRGLEPD